MGFSAANHHQSFARSLLAIHRQQDGDSDSDGININVRQDRKRKSSPRGNRLTSLDATTPPQAPACKSVAPSILFSSEEMPAMPFFAAEKEQQPRKLQRRRRSTATATVTQEQRRERRNMMFGRIAEYQSTAFRREYELGETIRCPSHMPPQNHHMLVIAIFWPK